MSITSIHQCRSLKAMIDYCITPKKGQEMVSYHLTKGEQLETVLNNTFKEIEDITDVHEMNNTQLKRIIQKIEVDHEGNVEVFLRLLGDLGLDESVLVNDDRTQGRHGETDPGQSFIGIRGTQSSESE